MSHRLQTSSLHTTCVQCLYLGDIFRFLWRKTCCVSEMLISGISILRKCVFHASQTNGQLYMTKLPPSGEFLQIPWLKPTCWTGNHVFSGMLLLLLQKGRWKDFAFFLPMDPASNLGLSMHRKSLFQTILHLSLIIHHCTPYRSNPFRDWP